mmetsp:Transcript_6243/g.10420  ORF Transcript_6243/g.10420 Transcript_6243/m.10420 type:complete len:381 (+) Transcript_6243:182-1324(+)
MLHSKIISMLAPALRLLPLLDSDLLFVFHGSGRGCLCEPRSRAKALPELLAIQLQVQLRSLSGLFKTLPCQFSISLHHSTPLVTKILKASLLYGSYTISFGCKALLLCCLLVQCTLRLCLAFLKARLKLLHLSPHASEILITLRSLISNGLRKPHDLSFTGVLRSVEAILSIRALVLLYLLPRIKLLKRPKGVLCTCVFSQAITVCSLNLLDTCLCAKISCGDFSQVVPHFVQVTLQAVTCCLRICAMLLQYTYSIFDRMYLIAFDFVTSHIPLNLTNSCAHVLNTLHLSFTQGISHVTSIHCLLMLTQDRSNELILVVRFEYFQRFQKRTMYYPEPCSLLRRVPCISVPCHGAFSAMPGSEGWAFCATGRAWRTVLWCR